ncbi:SAM-dependent methyltransferase [Streptomyces sp. NPDC051018]|uniref:SAM-dependent methyltransferase n=1 Tax=Streptomyces sp. NPDC051018 TaxID=3365639 RepID=UPI00378EBBF7
MPQTLEPRPPIPRREGSSAARLYAAYQGGKDAYQADLDIAARISALGLDPEAIAVHNRAFHNRAVRHAAGELGIHQFLDIGCGYPAESGPNTHDIVETVHPDTSRVLYVDNDPLVRAHADALLHSDGDGFTAVTEADLRDPDTILAAGRHHLDFTQPVCVLLVAVVHFLPDADDPHTAVHTLTRALPPGSCMILSHVTDDFAPEIMRQAEELLAGQKIVARTRPRARIKAFFDGLDLTQPGLVPVHQWHQPDPDITAIPAERIHTYGGIGLTT